MNQNESVVCLSHAYHRRTLIWKHWHKNIIAILKTELLVFRTATFLHLFRFRYSGKFWCGIAVFSLYHVRYCGILALPRAVLRYSYPPYDPPPFVGMRPLTLGHHLCSASHKLCVQVELTQRISQVHKLCVQKMLLKIPPCNTWPRSCKKSDEGMQENNGGQKALERLLKTLLPHL